MVSMMPPLDTTFLYIPGSGLEKEK